MKSIKWIAVFLALLVCLSGCAGTHQSGGSYNIYLIAKSSTTEFWKAVFSGANAAKSEYNVQLTILADVYKRQGKSTAIRHLTGVYRPDSGSVTMDEQPIYENPAVKAAIGYIPDEIFYYPSATLEDMRKFYRGIYPTFDDALFDKLYDCLLYTSRCV